MKCVEGGVVVLDIGKMGFVYGLEFQFFDGLCCVVGQNYVIGCDIDVGVGLVVYVGFGKGCVMIGGYIVDDYDVVQLLFCFIYYVMGVLCLCQCRYQWVVVQIGLVVELYGCDFDLVVVQLFGQIDYFGQVVKVLVMYYGVQCYGKVDLIGLFGYLYFVCEVVVIVVDLVGYFGVDVLQ